MFIVGDGKKPVYLISGFCVTVVKKYNFERHCTSNHADAVTLCGRSRCVEEV